MARSAFPRMRWWVWLIAFAVGVWVLLRTLTFNRKLKVARTYTAGRNGSMFVVADDGAVYRYANDPLTGDWNAAEEWGALAPGTEVHASGHGVRVPLLGLYPSLTSIRKIRN
eukprot:jgi/Tetstr1/463963/TSEL_008768.t1